MRNPDPGNGRSISPGSGVACPRFEPTIRQVSEFRRTIGGNIADLRRVGKSGSALPLPRIPHYGSLGETLPPYEGGKFTFHLNLKAFPGTIGMNNDAVDQGAKTADE